MTLDTSAILAVLQDEPEREEFVSLNRKGAGPPDIVGLRPRSGDGAGRAEGR
jgi:hypothetical protein